jgi:hypothetical protein
MFSGIRASVFFTAEHAKYAKKKTLKKSSRPFAASPALHQTQCGASVAVQFVLANKKAVREMDSPFSFRYIDLTCFPLGAAEYFHWHGHGH